MRAVIEHGLDRGALPVKLCYSGPFFRYERPQAGRYRQLQQVGVEAIGVDDPALDAEVIAVADAGSDRWASTASAWRSHRWATTPVARSTANYCRNSCSSSTSTRRLGSGHRSTRCGCSTTSDRTCGDDCQAPVMLDHLSQDAKRHFDTVLSHLDALGCRTWSTPHGARVGLLHQNDV